jgi:hypothetical protein
VRVALRGNLLGFSVCLRCGPFGWSASRPCRWTARQRMDIGSNSGVAMEAFNIAGVPRQSFCHAVANAGRNPLARWCEGVPGAYRHEPP